MSGKELSTLRAGLDSKAAAEATIAAGMDQSATPRIPEELSILPVRGLVIFPGTIIPLNVQRASSLKLLDDTLPRTKVIGLVTQRDEGTIRVTDVGFPETTLLEQDRFLRALLCTPPFQKRMSGPEFRHLLGRPLVLHHPSRWGRWGSWEGPAVDWGRIGWVK